jgi:hypothetical protein
LGVSPTDEELRIHRSVADGGIAGESLPLSETRGWLNKLLRANRVHEIYPKHAFEGMLGQFWIAAAHRSIEAGRPAAREFFRSRLAFRVGADECIRLLLHAARSSVRT